LVLYLVLGLIYSVATPIFEAADEIWHMAVVHHITHTGRLPVQPADPAETGLWRQQGSQPPLYYLVGAALTFWIDTGDLPGLVAYNPHASGGHPAVEGNKNILLHWPEAERFPYRGTALAVHLLRLYSLALGALTVYGTYCIARHLWPGQDELACLTAGLVAFNPQFIYIHAGVINDTLAICLCTWVVERLVWLLGQPAPLSRPRWRTWAWVGLGCGLALLSKLSAGFLLPLVGLAVVYLAWRERDWRPAVAPLLLAGGVALAVSGWWFARNWHLYGDLTGLSRFIPVAGARPGPFGLADFIGELDGMELSYWAVFGWFSILADQALYPAFKALHRIALLGWLFWGYRAARGLVRVERVTLARLGLLAAWLLILLVALYRWTMDVMATQGRLIFPGVSSVAVLLALGVGGWLPRRWRAGALGVLVAALAVVAAVTPFRYLAPAYRLPAAVADEASIPERVNLRYGDWGELVGYAVEEATLDPGEPLALTLYWRALRPIEETYDLYIHLRDAEGRLLGQLDTYPGWGMWPTHLWAPGQIVADRYRLPVAEAGALPSLGRIEVGFSAPGEAGPFPAYDPAGRQVTPIVGWFKVRGTEPQEPDLAPEAPRFASPAGPEIALARWSLGAMSEGSLVVAPGQRVTLELAWSALRQPAADYTVFVHLVGADPQPLAQADGEPQGGRYPTSWWEPGELVAEERTLEAPGDLAPGDYAVLVGLYRPADGVRLAAQLGNKEAAGVAQGDAYRLPVTLRVSPR